MAKARVSTNPLYKGGAGGYTFYVRDGEQVVRQRRNNSNYGESASRTELQQTRRVRWNNLVNVYKAIRLWQKKAYETLRKGQTDYNLFMQLNANTRYAALTKDMAVNGCGVWANYRISRGSLRSISCAWDAEESAFVTDINLSVTIGAGSTAATVAHAIIEENDDFEHKDNIALIMFINTKDARDYPYASSVYSEWTLNTSDPTAIAALPGAAKYLATVNGHLAIRPVASGLVGFAFIHTRVVNGQLLVSSQNVQVNGDAFWEEFDGPDWIQQCIDSYGVDPNVPLTPGDN